MAAELGLELEAVLAVFRDHWAAKAGHDAVKADWQATWRNWCRREAGRSMPVGKASAPPRTKLPPAGVNQPSVSSSIEAWVKTLPDTTLGTFDEGVERPVIAGCDVAAVAAAIADEAQLGPGEHDWNPIAEWLRAGYCPEKDILPAIRAVVRRPGYQPPRSLNFFTGAIRDAFGLATA